MSMNASESTKTAGHPVSVRWFITTIVIFSLFFAVFVYVSNPKSGNNQVADFAKKSVLPVELASSDDFAAWIDAWQKEDPYVTQDEFVLAETVDLAWLPESSEQLSAEKSVISSDEKYSANFSTKAENTMAWLSQPGQVALLESRRAPGYFQDIVWLNSNQVALLGTEAVYRPDESPLCIASDDGKDTVCYFRLTIDMVDVAAGKISRFVSEKHGFVAGQTVADGEPSFVEAVKENLDTALVNGTTMLEGTVMMFDGSELILSANDGSTAKVWLDENMEVSLPGGTQVGLDVIRRGLRMKLTGDMNGDQLLATSAEAVELPGFIIYEPVDGATVSELTVRGIVGRDVDKIVVRVRNQNTGVRFLDRTVDLKSLSDGYWQLISEEVDLAAFASSGDKLTLAVYDPLAQPNGQTFELEYQPTTR